MDTFGCYLLVNKKGLDELPGLKVQLSVLAQCLREEKDNYLFQANDEYLETCQWFLKTNEVAFKLV
jgi:hypothetical protein